VLAVETNSAGELIKRGPYQLTRRASNAPLVKSIDLGFVITNRLPSAILKRQTTNKDTNDFYLVVVSSNTTGTVQSKITVHTEPGQASAEDYCLRDLSNISILYAVGSPSGKSIGDSSWYRVDKQTQYTSVAFLRHNVFVHVFSEDASVCEQVARFIDEAIVANGKAVRLDKTVVTAPD
jgi:hypothetical protein